jgi:hypothetical protein
MHAIDILVNIGGEHCQVKLSMFGEKKTKKWTSFMQGKCFIVKHGFLRLFFTPVCRHSYNTNKIHRYFSRTFCFVPHLGLLRYLWCWDLIKLRGISYHAFVTFTEISMVQGFDKIPRNFVTNRGCHCQVYLDIYGAGVWLNSAKFCNKPWLPLSGLLRYLWCNDLIKFRKIS